MIARSLEIAGIRTTLTSWNQGSIKSVYPPRSTLTSLKRGMTLGHPNNKEQQIRILKSTLDLLSCDAPIVPVMLKEK